MLFLMLAPMISFFVINFFLSHWLSWLLKFTYPNKVSLCMTTLARNSPIALAVAVAVSGFPEQPIVSHALVIGSLIELPVLVLVSQIMLRERK